MSTTTFEQRFRIPEVLPEHAQDLAGHLGERSLAGSDIAPVAVSSEVVVDRDALMLEVQLRVSADEAAALKAASHTSIAEKIKANFENRRQASWQAAQSQQSRPTAPVGTAVQSETAPETTLLPERGTDGCIKWSADPHIMLAQVAAARARQLQPEVVSDNASDAIRYNADGIRIWPSSPHEIIAANQEALRRSRENTR